jgi:hypothetical protein
LLAWRWNRGDQPGWLRIRCGSWRPSVVRRWRSSLLDIGLDRLLLGIGRIHRLRLGLRLWNLWLPVVGNLGWLLRIGWINRLALRRLTLGRLALKGLALLQLALGGSVIRNLGLRLPIVGNLDWLLGVGWIHRLTLRLAIIWNWSLAIVRR